MKEFLKPTITKAVIALIIFLLIPFPNIHQECVTEEGYTGQPSCVTVTSWVQVINLFFNFTVLKFDNRLRYYGVNTPYWIISILASYILSCLIVSILTKKGKSKK